MNSDVKRKVREAQRAFERGYREDEGDPRVMAPSIRKEAFKRRAERLSRELEACEGQEARREVLRKFEARMRREGYTADEVAEALRDVRRKSKERRDAEASITKERVGSKDPDDFLQDDEGDEDDE